MTARDVSHVEIYTRDKSPVIHRLVSGLGFTRVADCVEVDRSSVLLTRGGAGVVVTSGWAACFTRPHHRRAGDVGVRCDDVTAVREAALAAGAAVTRSAQGHPVVSGIGPVTCTLLPAAPHTGFLPDGRTWVPCTPRPSRTAGTRPSWTAPDDGDEHLELRLDGRMPDRHAAFYRDVLDVASTWPAPSAGPDILALAGAPGGLAVLCVAGVRTG
ncbi:hypothetical protein [Streptomyces sp. NPDC047000]|uniref:hypothetical protein n=1 Tax=Streptomyces sp. NPDC047000 TaxID=3155474 RepID=UPI0033C4BDC7